APVPRSDDMWTFGRKIAVGFALSFIVLGAVGLVAYRSISSLTTTSYQVTHLSDAETGQRGFVITGDEQFLEPYTAATQTIERTVRELREQTADNPAQ